jgi:hypothetical protein
MIGCMVEGSSSPQIVIVLELELVLELVKEWKAAGAWQIKDRSDPGGITERGRGRVRGRLRWGISVILKSNPRWLVIVLVVVMIYVENG